MNKFEENKGDRKKTWNLINQLRGKTKTTLTSSTTNVNVSDYSKGTYMLTLIQSDKKKIKTYKIVKN